MSSTQLLTKVLRIPQRHSLRLSLSTAPNVICCYHPVRMLQTSRCVNEDVPNLNRFAKDNLDKNTSPNREVEKLKKIMDKSKLLTRLRQNPRFSHYFNNLLEASPIPTIASFFILHELTAIIPLFSIWYLLYSWDIFGDVNFSNKFITQCSEAIERLVGARASDFADEHHLIISGALSYALVKVLAPIRIIVSLWGAPYVARWMVIPFRNLRKVLQRRSNP